MKYKLICYSFFIFMGGLFLAYPTMSYSEEKKQDMLNNFHYQVLFPKNQLDKEVGYFDLSVKPEQKQIVQIRLSNTSNKPIPVMIKLSGAKTNSNGIIEYGPNQIKQDDSLRFDFEEIVKGPDKVILSPNSSKTIDFELTVPVTPFKGYIAGGIQLQPFDEQEEKQQQNQDTVINEFAFVIGMRLSESDPSKILPKLRFNQLYYGSKDGALSLFVNFSNTQPVYVEGMEINANIRKKGSNKVLFEINKKDMRMAPNSMIDFPIPIVDKRLKQGQYSIDINIKTASAKNWHWSTNFTVSKAEAEKLKSQNKDNGSFKGRYLGFILLLGISLGTGSLLLFYLYKGKKSSKKRVLMMKKRKDKNSSK